MLSVTQIMSIKQRIMFKTFELIYKVKNKMTPAYLHGNFSFVKEVHQYPTLGADDFCINSSRLSSTLNSIFFRGLRAGFTTAR